LFGKLEGSDGSPSTLEFRLWNHNGWTLG
jgi:hypothetical protein